LIRIPQFLLASTLCAAALLPVGASLTSPAHAAEIDVWIGTASSQLSQGIYHCTLNTDNGKLSPARLVAEASGPGFLAMHPKLPVLYAVGTLDGTPSVIAYTIGKDPQGKAALTLIGSLPIGDGGGTHLAVDATGTTLLTAQYGGGSVAVFALDDDGSLDRRTQLIKHEGGSRVVQGRQEAPHTHWVGFSPDNRFAFAPDLGLDQVVIYRVDAAKSELTPHGHADVPPGGGPRHMKFHPSGKWAYVLNELDLTVSVFDYDAEAGTMTRKQTVRAVPQRALNREQFVSASEIRVHPSGKFVYSANRGHDTITVFEVDADSGELKSVQRANVRGATPRNFNLDPSAKWLLAAGQDSHSLASFVVEEAGTLQFNRSVIHVPSPICVLFQPE
jgi:6-phosphogluconolactonase